MKLRIRTSSSQFTITEDQEQAFAKIAASTNGAAGVEKSLGTEGGVADAKGVKTSGIAEPMDTEEKHICKYMLSLLKEVLLNRHLLCCKAKSFDGHPCIVCVSTVL